MNRADPDGGGRANEEALAHRVNQGLPSGGEEGDRTLDLRIANAALSQLSYFPGPHGLAALGATVKCSGEAALRKVLLVEPERMADLVQQRGAKLLPELLGVMPNPPQIVPEEPDDGR